MKSIKVLFLYIHNSTSTQIAEAYLKIFGVNKFYCESACLEVGKLNPLAIEVMKEEAIAISQNKTNDVFDFSKNSKLYDINT